MVDHLDVQRMAHSADITYRPVNCQSNSLTGERVLGTICVILAILLLLLQMKPMRASQASCFRIRTPVNLGAFFLKFGSEEDH